MDYDKLIEQLNAWNEQHLSVVCGGKHFACDYLCENEDCIVVRAATAIEILRADLDRLAVMCNQRMSMRDEVLERFSLTKDIPLDRLRKLVELYNNVPHICDYCIGCEIEPTDGHGCDEYDNFVFSVRRIVAALKAREQE